MTFAPTSGNYTFDAAMQPPGLVALLNAVRSDGIGATCSFTATTPLKWSVGDWTKSATQADCTSGDSGGEPDWAQLKYTSERTASLEVGAGMSVSAEVKILGVVGNEVSAKFEAAHDWTNTQSLTRSSKVYIPDNSVVDLWTAPTTAEVRGTLTATAGNAKYTILNFAQIKYGVREDDLTPEFNVRTCARPMTAAERAKSCVKAATASAARARFAAIRGPRTQRARRRRA